MLLAEGGIVSGFLPTSVLPNPAQRINARTAVHAKRWRPAHI